MIQSYRILARIMTNPPPGPHLIMEQMEKFPMKPKSRKYLILKFPMVSRLMIFQPILIKLGLLQFQRQLLTLVRTTALLYRARLVKTRVLTSPAGRLEGIGEAW